MIMRLREIVAKYLEVGGGYGRSVALSSFGLSRKEAEQIFSALEEDYQISRFFHFSMSAAASYEINGYPQTHLSIDEEIKSIL